MRYLLPLLATASFAVLPISAQALTASQSVQKETTVITADGTSKIVREAAAKVVPGERIVYTLDYENDQVEAAKDIVLTMPIPKEVAFIEGTANTQTANVTYSADNGESYASRQAVMVLGNNGTVRAASAGELTHIRWAITQPVASGAKGMLSFAANVK